MANWEALPEWYHAVDLLVGGNPDLHCGVEVGVWKGTLSARILAYPHIRHLYLVDSWQVHYKLNGEKVTVFGPGYTQQLCDEARRATRTVVEAFPTKVDVIRLPSLEAAREVEDYSQDFVLIDACHEYESVADDLDAWVSKVRRGGLFMGDDFGPDFPGVERAVRERYGTKVDRVGPAWFVRV